MASASLPRVMRMSDPIESRDARDSDFGLSDRQLNMAKDLHPISKRDSSMQHEIGPLAHCKLADALKTARLTTLENPLHSLTHLVSNISIHQATGESEMRSGASQLMEARLTSSENPLEGRDSAFGISERQIQCATEMWNGDCDSRMHEALEGGRRLASKRVIVLARLEDAVSGGEGSVKRTSTFNFQCNADDTVNWLLRSVAEQVQIEHPNAPPVVGLRALTTNPKASIGNSAGNGSSDVLAGDDGSILDYSSRLGDMFSMCEKFEAMFELAE